MLLDGARPNVGVVRLRFESKTHVAADAKAEIRELGILGRRGDHLVDFEIGDAGGLTVVARRLVSANRLRDAARVVAGMAECRSSGDLLLDERPKIERDLELVPSGLERATHHRIGCGSPLRGDEGAAVSSALDHDVAERCEARERLADGRRADLEQTGQLLDGRQLLPDHELPEGDRRDEAIRDPCGSRFGDEGTQGDDRRVGPFVDHDRALPPYHRCRNLAIVREQSTMLESSTASSVPCMFLVRGP